MEKSSFVEDLISMLFWSNGKDIKEIIILISYLFVRVEIF